MIIVARVPKPVAAYFVANGSIRGARPAPHSQTFVAGRLPAATRAALTGCPASQRALAAMRSVRRRLPVPRGMASKTG